MLKSNPNEIGPKVQNILLKINSLGISVTVFMVYYVKQLFIMQKKLASDRCIRQFILVA